MLAGRLGTLADAGGLVLGLVGALGGLGDRLLAAAALGLRALGSGPGVACRPRRGSPSARPARRARARGAARAWPARPPARPARARPPPRAGRWSASASSARRARRSARTARSTTVAPAGSAAPVSVSRATGSSTSTSPTASRTPAPSAGRSSSATENVGAERVGPGGGPLGGARRLGQRIEAALADDAGPERRATGSPSQRPEMRTSTTPRSVDTRSTRSTRSPEGPSPSRDLGLIMPAEARCLLGRRPAARENQRGHDGEDRATERDLARGFAVALAQERPAGPSRPRNQAPGRRVASCLDPTPPPAGSSRRVDRVAAATASSENGSGTVSPSRQRSKRSA